jgi:hypothetical protein
LLKHFLFLFVLKGKEEVAQRENPQHLAVEEFKMNVQRYAR